MRASKANASVGSEASTLHLALGRDRGLLNPSGLKVFPFTLFEKGMTLPSWKGDAGVGEESSRVEFQGTRQAGYVGPRWEESGTYGKEC